MKAAFMPSTGKDRRKQAKVSASVVQQVVAGPSSPAVRGASRLLSRQALGEQ